MTDYEKIAASAPVEGEVIPPEEVEEFQRAANREYLPLDHPKYAGIAKSKGYGQTEEDGYGYHRIQKVRYNHEAMIDEIIANPSIQQKQLAAKFGVSENWISTVYGSDAFQAALAKRRDDLMSPEVVSTIEERIAGLAHQSISVIAEKLETTRSADLAIKGLEIATKAMGFGARNAGNGQTNQFIIQLPPKSESAQDWSERYNPEMKQLPSSED